MAAALAVVVLTGDGLGGTAVPTTEVVVTLDGAPLSVFGRSLLSARHTAYLQRVTAQQSAVARTIRAEIPGSTIRWRYRLVANGLAVVLPQSEVGRLARVPGVARVWPNVRYHALATTAGPEQIGADALWALGSLGDGMKIGFIDDGIDAAHPYFNPGGLQYPPGFPKGQTKYATPKVIVQRAFAPPSPKWKYATVPFDPTGSFHATHVAGIAAGAHGVNANGTVLSGVAPNAWIGNYKALTIPTPGFGLDGNSAEITAAIEAAVADGMNVINLSLGEPEVEPSRDIVVKAIDAAAAAGVVPVIAAGNDYDAFGDGSVSSPANAPDAITVASVTSRDTIADDSSGGPTPVSLQMKPDVAAPGVDVLSSLPTNQGGPWGRLSGTSMATPHVAAAAALLKERHPTWTVAQVKSALVQTGDPVRTTAGAEVPSTREGGGLVDLVKADNPLVFAAPTGLSFGALTSGATVPRTVALTDAGNGAGDWTVSVVKQTGSGSVTAPPTVTVPGSLVVNATGGPTTGDVTGFVVLMRGADTRRIPFWFLTTAPRLAAEKKLTLARRGVYRGTTAGAPSLVTRYRYPTGGDARYAGPERAYRIRVSSSVANAGVVVLSGSATPHVTFDGSEDRLAGYTGLPLDLNPYRRSYGARRKAAAVVLPARGLYDFVFDTSSAGAAGPFTFRYWVNDVTPPRLRLLSRKNGTIVVAATDAGSGVDPASITATVDGKNVTATFTDGAVRIRTTRGRHLLDLSVADYQETKNMEDVPPILPNTSTLRTIVAVR